MVSSSGVLVYSCVAQSCVRLKMKPVPVGQSQESDREVESLQLGIVNPEDLWASSK